MGYDMSLYSVDRQSVEIVAKTLGMSVEKVLKQSFDLGYPIDYHSDEDIPTDIFEYVRTYQVSMHQVLEGLKRTDVHMTVDLSIYDEIAYSSKRALKQCFIDLKIEEPENSSLVVLEKPDYMRVLNYLEKHLKAISIYDAYIEGNKEDIMDAILSVYKSMKQYERLDFDKYIVYFTHSW